MQKFQQNLALSGVEGRLQHSERSRGMGMIIRKGEDLDFARSSESLRPFDSAQGSPLLKIP
jgi:hypothetical protein